MPVSALSNLGVEEEGAVFAALDRFEVAVGIGLNKVSCGGGGVVGWDKGARGRFFRLIWGRSFNYTKRNTSCYNKLTENTLEMQCYLAWKMNLNRSKIFR